MDPVHLTTPSWSFIERRSSPCPLFLGVIVQNNTMKLGSRLSRTIPMNPFGMFEGSDDGSISVRRCTCATHV
ncbi:hypothetical protein A0H81_05002 [Grifola frondosa]|uniref:Uncharacterized protein n=1 Tax=Grifola frondosa TaxID=5627 RepID=A0A1C7MDX6_GRIFR|nr:hypothetical protein A0H81_05002 [Grifola frondosa]